MSDQPVIKALLFDTDGTLTSYWDYWYPFYKQAAKAVATLLDQPDMELRLLESGGLDPEEDSLDPFGILAVGSEQEIIDFWANQTDMMEKPRVVQELGRLFLEHTRTPAPTTTNLSLLFQRLRFRNIKIGVAGSDKVAGIQAMLARYKASSYVDFVAGSDSGFGNKFDNGQIQAFSRAVHRPVEQIAVVGDSTTDMEDAKGSEAGMAVAVLTGSASRAILDPLADAVLTDIGEIESILS